MPAYIQGNYPMATNVNKATLAPAPAPATITAIPQAPATVATLAGTMVPVLPVPLYGKAANALGGNTLLVAGKRQMPLSGANATYSNAVRAALAAGNGSCTVQVACNYCTAAGNKTYSNWAIGQGWLVPAPTPAK